MTNGKGKKTAETIENKLQDGIINPETKVGGGKRDHNLSASAAHH